MGATSGMKHDSFIDADWDSASSEAPGQDLFHKPFKATMPPGRLFHGEIDGSSFPSGGLRSTSKAAAFTSWDRASPPFVYSGTCYIPCALVSPNGSSLDDKTPLLRSNDAVQREGLRLLKNIDIGSNKHHYEDVKQVATYLGWEQEFFVVSKEAFLARPDLRACGRTLFGALPTKGMQTDLNYFAAMPPSVKACLNEVHEELLKIGCPLNVHHNEVKHEGRKRWSFLYFSLCCDDIFNYFFTSNFSGSREAFWFTMTCVFVTRVRCVFSKGRSCPVRDLALLHDFEPERRPEPDCHANLLR